MPSSPLPHALGRFELLEELGRDATSVGYRGRDPKRDRAVFVKALVRPPGVSEKEWEAFEARFLEEARRVALVSHPGLVATLDYGKDEETGTLFVAQEYLAGLSLAETLTPGEPRPWEEGLRLVAWLSEALARLHHAGLVHREVRPRNIILGDSGAPKLAHPGLARFGTARLTPTSARQAFGVFLYVSPEQAVGERVDARTDIFALGAVAYRLLTGRDAFEGRDPDEILAHVIHDRPAPASALVPGLPPGVDAVLAQALAKPRKDRYSDAQSFRDDVDDLLAGRPPRHARSAGSMAEGPPVPAEASTPTTATGIASARFVRRPLVRGIAGVAVLALVAGLDLLRRALETPDAAPAGRPAVEPAQRSDDPGGPPALPGLPSRDETPRAVLAIDLKHTLQRGTFVVLVDGSPVLEQRISAAVKRSVLGIKLREGRLRQTVEVAPGRHQIVVKVRWEDKERTDTITGSFTAARTRQLSARFGGIGKRLSLEWD